MTDPLRWWARTPTHAFELDDPHVVPAISRVAWVGVEYPELENDRYLGHLTHKVLYGDMCLGFVRAIQIDGDNRVLFDRQVGHLASTSAWRVAGDGFVYAVSYARCTHGTDADLPPGKLMRATLSSRTE